MVAQTRENIATVVQEYLRRNPGEGEPARVVAEDVRLGDAAHAWWWVPVVFDADPHKRHLYYELFSTIEEQLDENEHLNVLLIPRPTQLPEP